MQYVNDDMDDVFRRAAENYPLDTSGSDWNKVLKALQDEGQVVPPTPAKNGKGRFFWILLLIPFSFICNGNLQPGRQEAGLEQSDNRDAKISGTSKSDDERENLIQPAEHPTPGTAILPGTVNTNTADPSINNPGTGNPVLYATIPSGAEGQLSNKVVRSSTTSGKSYAGKYSSTRMSRVETKRKQDRNTVVEKFLTMGSPALILTENLSLSTPPELAGLITKAEPRPSIIKDHPAGITKDKVREKKFYAGVMAGVDATVIKFQKVEGAGYDGGVVMGYDLKPKLAIEGGIFYQEKSYYTDGKYYNTKNIYMPPNSRVAHVSALCKMIEVPLYLKYTFHPSKKSSGYATLGMSSYFMKREDYSYAYQYSSGTIHVYDKTYKNSSTNILSAIHISGGLSRQLGKNNTLRLEPYLKIPVRSMGYGEMKLWSTGVHVGVTRRMF